jgi:hypothetical protein
MTKASKSLGMMGDELLIILGSMSEYGYQAVMSAEIAIVAMTGNTIMKATDNSYRGCSWIAKVLCTGKCRCLWKLLGIDREYMGKI